MGKNIINMICGESGVLNRIQRFRTFDSLLARSRVLSEARDSAGSAISQVDGIGHGTAMQLSFLGISEIIGTLSYQTFLRCRDGQCFFIMNYIN